MRRGRPLRFLILSLAGWSGARAVLLWPIAHAITVISELVGFPEAAAALLAYAPPSAATPIVRRERRPVRSAAVANKKALAAVAVALADAPPDDAARPAPIPPPPMIPMTARTSRRFAGSVWFLARGGQTAGFGGQLGASQAGARLTYALVDARNLALSARIAAPLRGLGREAAIGIDWQPFAAPLHIIAEQRIALDDSGGGPALFAVGGVGPTDIGRGMRIDAYAQAGAVVRGEVQPFADGAARLTRRVGERGGLRIDLGLGAWGGAQRGAARADLGPSVSIATRTGGRSLRLTLDWRERIVGNARPGSGPALSIGSDF